MRGINYAHSRIQKILSWPWFREGNLCIEVKIEKIRPRGLGGWKCRPVGFSMRRIDCAHFQILKMLSWPWFREGNLCIEAIHVGLFNKYLPLIKCFNFIIFHPFSMKFFSVVWKGLEEPERVFSHMFTTTLSENEIIIQGRSQGI